EARRYGAHSAMPLPTAKKLCPHAIFLPVNGAKYVHVSRRLMKILQRYSPQLEPVSVDEAFLNISGLARIYKSEKELGRKIKRDILDELQLTCTIGIASSKILAKLASGLNKPDGLNIIEDEEMERIVYPLPVRKLWGIGEATEKALARLGIKTIGNLACFPELKLKKVFGKNGPLMARAAAGKLDSPVHGLEELPAEKSVGHEHTFRNDTDDVEQIRAQLLLLVQRVGRRMRKRNVRGKTVTLKLRYENFETHTHRTSLNSYTNNEGQIFSLTEQLWRQIYNLKRKIRLIGVSVSHLVEREPAGLELPFRDEQLRIKADDLLLPTVDKIKDTYGENAIWRASGLLLKRE
ncbi:MAG TPA: DNA polymerase IV, partial [Bacteroidetes bacterium]|nr:DNA polymerase IV [Bacteroidota bacterium]